MDEVQRRELTANEKRGIRGLVKKHCANYDAEQRECLPLECECYMFGKHFTGALCRYFQNAVLPLEPKLVIALTQTGVATKACKMCGRHFAINGRQVYCSERCSQARTRAATAARVRKYRNL